jgi:hypothetical protein
MSEFVLGQLKSLVAETTVLVPVYELHIEVPFALGNGEFRSIGEADLSRWETDRQVTSPGDARSTAESISRLRNEVQGRGAYWTTVVAEPVRAAEIAWQRANEAVALLRIFSKGMFQPLARSYLTPLGMEAVLRQRYLLIVNGVFRGGADISISPPPFYSSYDKVFIEESVLPSLAPLNRILVSEGRTSFEEDLLNAVFVYSRAGQYNNVSEKLIHMLVALESILLRDENEPIGVSISERIAFLVGDSATSRLEIAKNVKAVYRLRSRFIHHGDEVKTTEEQLDTLRTFMRSTFQCFMNLAHDAHRYPTRDHLITAIEARKYA